LREQPVFLKLHRRDEPAYLIHHALTAVIVHDRQRAFRIASSARIDGTAQLAKLVDCQLPDALD
jgi:hypothetical protein